MKFLKIVLHIIPIVFLTIITQVGGLFYLIALILRPYVLKRLKFKRKKSVLLGLFFVLYSLGSFIIVPRIAKSYGREPLPVFSSKNQAFRGLLPVFVIFRRNFVIII